MPSPPRLYPQLMKALCKCVAVAIHHCQVPWWIAALLCCCLPATNNNSLADDSINFVTDVRPILEQHCYSCHGPEKQKSGLRLDIKQAAFQGGDGYGPSIVAGQADASPLFQLVLPTADVGQRMPLEHEPLSDATIAVLRQWIEQGAAWPDGVDHAVLEDRSDHWSFKPLSASRPTSMPPAMADSDIDASIRRQLADHQLQLSPPASRRVWLRRVYLDLHGLLPDAATAERFENGSDPQDYNRIVDELLASARYGERYAQHWLDVVRYADTDGFEVNTPRANAWPYRDYVIDALNCDLPYDQFIREQLAGDQHGVEAATGFLVTAAALLPGQIGQDEASKRLARQDELAEIVINTGEAFLGLSIGCARCHDHKFDAISQRDYYAMQAFFSGVRYGERPLLRATSEAKQAEAETIETELQAIRQVRIHSQPTRQEPSPFFNEVKFTPSSAKLVRFEILDANLHPTLGLIEPCIDEFEIYDQQGNNIALASLGTKVTASGSLTSELHKLEHVNDGRVGNSFSWMSNEAGRGWLLFELPEAITIDRIVWSRDRDGQFTDRLATLYTLEIGDELSDMQQIAGPDAKQLIEWREAEAKERSLQQRLDEVRQVPMVFAGQFVEPEPCFRLLRGDPEQPLEPIAPAVLSTLGNIELTTEASDALRRQTLANWITAPNQPLTARVMANRIWQWHFGTGLVATPSDLGRQGERPSNSELLDWLAAEFIRSGWSVKHMHRLIVLSATYRQASDVAVTPMNMDADVRWLWRYPSRRIEAETLRDVMLQVSGELHHTVGGPGFDLFQSRGGLNGFPPVETFGEDGLRRMIYAHKVRMERDAVFGAFDCPDAGQSLPRRRQSTTPTQALNLFNSQFTLDRANALASRIEHKIAADCHSSGNNNSLDAKSTTLKIEQAFQIVLGRLPALDERQAIEPIVQEHGLVTLCRALLNSNEFLFIP